MNTSSMCANCFAFLTPEGYCKKCRRISEAAPLQKEEKVQKTLKDESATDVGGNTVHISYESDPKLIKAVNRTTYAIRSMALFLFISLCSSVCGYALIAASTGNPVRCAANGSDCGEPGLAIFGWVVLAAGFCVALVVGISELGKSKL